MREIDIEELNTKFNGIIKRQLPTPTQEDIITFKPLVELILESKEKIIVLENKNNNLEFNKLRITLRVITAIQYLTNHELKNIE